MLFAGVVLKFVPEIITEEPVVPDVGVKEVIVGTWASSVPATEISITRENKIFK
jgi:hypothetical protein